ncbi:MAG TPA: sulfatase [Terriglobales bacterium]|nr:sulfatase [Terriglobales bacterium]
MSPLEPTLKSLEERASITASVGTTALIAIWFGIFAGIIEGVGLLIFQRLNWASWGPMLHVSLPILWISPLVNVSFFLVLAFVSLAIAKAAGLCTSAIQPVVAVPAVLAFATVYDWLTLTGRLYHKSSLLLALGVAVGFSRWITKRQQWVFTFWQKTLPALVGVFLFALLSVEGGQRWREHHAIETLPAANPALPNLIVIVVDTLRADHLSAYGYQRPTSPNLDRLAREGVLFQNAISTSSWSLPSHVSLVTGRYVYEHGADNVKPMPLFGANGNNLGNLPTIGQQLQALGYRTGAFSANRTWFSHDLGFERGFIHFDDYFNSPADILVRTLYGREFARIYLSRTDHSKPKRFLRWVGWDSLLDPDEEGSGSRGGALGVRKRASAVNAEFEEWMGRDAGQHPFFAFLNYFDVHRHYGGPRGYPKPDWPHNVPADEYDDSIRYVDDCLGQLLSKLHARGLDKNTLLVITSDHGESLGEHGLEDHGNSLYWNLIHVPLILWWPDHVPASVRVISPVTNAVIPATLMQMVGTTPPPSFRRPTLDSLWKAPASSEQPVLSELSVSPYASKKDRPPDPVPTAVSGPMSSIVSGNWQLIIHAKYGKQLYDWARDPAETNDLASTSAGRREASALISQLQGLMSNSGTSPKSPSGF